MDLEDKLKKSMLKLDAKNNGMTNSVMKLLD